ncbi:ankycorbin isoform X2 [Coccinella septempunctata]|uniref:ankycorbin isoform X2 n=1 Tax=Coccinella septempunctata TaxID=41139 RepID=UPI001D06E588|nr:ankycorbin isoform X2 [Coccinella septempunctata]
MLVLNWTTLCSDLRHLLYERDRTKKTALHYCCTSDNKRAAQVADYLTMAAPELVETKDEDGFTPLHLAVIAGNMSLVTFLIANHADVNAVDNEKHTVVHWATVCGETEALRAVIAAGAPVSSPDVHRGYPLHYAAQMCGGNEKDANLGFQVLQTLLTTNGIDVTVEDGDGRQPLLWAASAGSAKAVLALIRAGSPVEAADKDGLTALHCAASRGHTDCLDTLLTLCGASCDIIDSNGCTALHYAVTLGHADATALLLAHGSDPNRQDRKGRSPAHCGCSKGQFETVKMLGAHGANLWLKNARGDLPLHEAAASGRRDLVKWLLTMRPSQVNARNNDGRCPLHLAALNDNADMCKILLDSGAQINPVLRTSKNVFMTPLDCALRRGFRSTAKYLQLHGGVPASRLQATQHQNANSAVSMQIRDDITFWGDTSSDSERENGELNKHFMKIQKKKLAQKYKRKRGSASASEFENRVRGKMDEQKSSRKHSEKARARNDSATSVAALPKKSSRGRFDYSNEIVINGNTEINIHQTRAISVGREVDVPIDQQIHEKLVSSKNIDSSRTKDIFTKSRSAKQVVDTGANRSDSDRSSTARSSASNSIKSIKIDKRRRKDLEVKDQSTNTIERMKDRASSIQVAKSDAAVITDDYLIDSLREDKSAMMNYQSSKMSDTSEDQERQQNIVVEASIHEPPKTLIIDEVQQQSLQDSERLPEKNSLTQEIVEENIEKEVTETLDKQISNELKSFEEDSSPKLSEEKEDEKNIAGEDLNIGINEVTNADTEESTQEQPESISDKTKMNEEEVKIDNEKEETTNEVQEENKARADSGHTDVPEFENDENQRSRKLSNLKRILSHDTFLRNQEPSEGSQEGDGTANEVADAAIGLINLNIEQELSLKIHGVEQADLDKSEGQDPEDISSNTEIMNTGDTTVRQISEDKPNVPETNEEESARIDNGVEDIMEKAFGEAVTGEQFPSEPASGKGLREGKRPRDSIMKTPTPTDDSTISSINDSKTHKSFTVLDDKEPDDNKTKRKSGKKKLNKPRSKSEENDKRARRPSKIPTPLGKTMLSKSEKNLNLIEEKMESGGKVGFLPDTNNRKNTMNEPYRSRSTISGRRVSIYSDEKGSGSEDDDRERMPSRRRRVKKRSHRRDSRSAGSDYESSNVIDSGFEPSPRSVRVPKWKNMSERGVNMTSVTQSIQSNIRRYHLERKIFQHLLELKRLQIRSGQHNEATLVKRAIDAYHTSCASTVGAGRYISRDLSFKAFEKFLYDSLRKLQKFDPEYLKGLPEAPNNPLLCTRSTHRCMHATHAYTGVPCAAYLPKLDHHTIPKIGFNDCKPGTGGFLPNINPKKSVTLELCHGNDKQIISLPADRLDQNKRYYVTFTVKGTENDGVAEDVGLPVSAHRHSRSD